MLRITRTDMKGTPWLRLEGKLVGEWVSEFRAACSPSSERVKPVALDLSEVTFVDAEGVHLLRQLIENGMEVTACSAFVTELLRSETVTCKLK